MRHWQRLAASLMLIAPATALPLSPAPDAGTVRQLDPNDWEAPPVETNWIESTGTTKDVLADDPLRLVPKLPFVQRYSLDTDHWEVWLCGNTGYTMSAAIADLEAATVDYYDKLSGGRYQVTFSPGGTSTDPYCLNDLRDPYSGTLDPIGDPEGILIVDSVTGGGYASPGNVCLDSGNCEWIGSTFPDNGRYAVVGASALAGFFSIATHELGHTIHWPHSNSGQSEYDNPIDLMSGNSTIDGYTEPLPYGTPAFNRYQAGWIDPADVVMAGAVYQEVSLQPFDAPGIQMIAVPTSTAGLVYTLGTRVSSAYDPIPGEWEGVEVYRIDHRCAEFSYPCPGIYREQLQEPPNPEGVAHVLQVGEGITLEGIQLEVIGRDGDGFVVAVGDPENTLPFVDIAASGFVNDILWLADTGITKGCNPPTNSRFCPSATVTREQMAAFLVRALGLTDNGGGNQFVDDDGSVFEEDIAKLAAAGITRGCNPPDNTMFCPDARVTREQMAAFLVRAFGLTDDGGGNTFTDDDGSIFEEDIARLAAAGITRGCNPPDNTEFCPYSPVTREQMAAFLHRAGSG